MLHLCFPLQQAATGKSSLGGLVEAGEAVCGCRDEGNLHQYHHLPDNSPHLPLLYACACAHACVLELRLPLPLDWNLPER